MYTSVEYSPNISKVLQVYSNKKTNESSPTGNCDFFPSNKLPLLSIQPRTIGKLLKPNWIVIPWNTNSSLSLSLSLLRSETPLRREIAESVAIRPIGRRWLIKSESTSN